MNFLAKLSKNYKSTNFVKIRPAAAELLDADGQTDTHDEANSGFSQFCESPYKFINTPVIHILCS